MNVLDHMLVTILAAYLLTACSQPETPEEWCMVALEAACECPDVVNTDIPCPGDDLSPQEAMDLRRSGCETQAARLSTDYGEESAVAFYQCFAERDCSSAWDSCAID